MLFFTKLVEETLQIFEKKYWARSQQIGHITRKICC